MLLSLPPDPDDLTVTANVLAYLKDMPASPTTETLNLIQQLITRASYFLQTNLGRTFTVDTYNEYRDGTGSQRMVFGNFPVTAVNSLTIGSKAVPPSSGEGVPGYKFSDITLYLIGHWQFWRGFQNVIINYSAGFASTPPDVEGVCIDLVCRKWKDRDRIGLVSKAIAGETTMFSKTDLTDEFKSLLRQYQKVTPI